MIVKLFKFLIGVALLPICFAVTRTLFFLLLQIKPDSPALVSPPAWGFLLGFGLWLLLFTVMPHPVRTYVFGHEMTHAFWGWISGARVSNMRVGEEGGSVLLSKSNFLTALAPYYFPFYTIIVLLVYLVLLAFSDLHTYKPFWMGLIGLTWSFHLTFTVRMLREHQSDITTQGRLFSYTTIYAVNLLEICLLIVAMAAPDMRLFLVKLTNDILNTIAWGSYHLQAGVDYLQKSLQ